MVVVAAAPAAFVNGCVFIAVSAGVVDADAAVVVVSGVAVIAVYVVGVWEKGVWRWGMMIPSLLA